MQVKKLVRCAPKAAVGARAIRDGLFLFCSFNLEPRHES